MAANPRAAAVAALVRQEQDGFSNLVLDAELKRQQLEGRDKAFASAIFYTVLEHRGTLDYILCQFLPKGLAKLDAPVREILRAALAQARYMQVPVSAAVNEAVKLTRAFKKSSASGLVNAVLRKACSYDLSTASFKNEVERLMVLGSAGRDVAEFLHKNYPDEALDILTYKADGGMTSLRANPLKGSADELCAKLLASGAKEAKRGIVPGSVLARFEGSPAENELFRQGYFHVEGQASQLAALCVDAQPGETVIDLCAAPGGKTILLAEQMHSTGRLYSCDAAENRVGLIRTAVQRMGLTNVEALCNDATKVNPALPQADRILADVPCSGLGILAKKPDLRYKKLEPAREAELLATQSAILDTAAQLLKAGGRLVYSTCTIDPAENQQQIAAFLARHPEFTLCDLNACGFGRPGEENRAPGCTDITRCRRIWPADGGEGHFMAKLKKNPDAEAPAPVRVKPGKPAKTPPEWLDFVKTTFPFLADRPLTTAGDWLLLPVPGSELLNLSKLRIVRGGVLAGSVLKKRFQPAHALFMAYGARCTNREELTLDDPRTAAWLRGEEINAATAQNGWCAVLVDGFPLGGGKASGGRIKNHYPKGLRSLQ